MAGIRARTRAFPATWGRDLESTPHPTQGTVPASTRPRISLSSTFRKTSNRPRPTQGCGKCGPVKMGSESRLPCATSPERLWMQRCGIPSAALLPEESVFLLLPIKVWPNKVLEPSLSQGENKSHRCYPGTSRSSVKLKEAEPLGWPRHKPGVPSVEAQLGRGAPLDPTASDVRKLL